MGKGSNTTTQSKTYTPAAMGAYQDVLSRAAGVASLPYQAYTGQLTAGINPYQEQAFGAINQAAGFASPYISEAAGLTRGASAPITGGDIDQYMNPYTQRVVDATQAQFDENNKRAQSSLVGNAAAKGALGGDRVSVAQSTLAGEQMRAQNPVIAGLYSQGYQGALAGAQAEKLRQMQAAGQLGGFGVSGTQAGLAGAQAMLQAGTLEQQTEQQRLAALYNQYQLAQAFPYQQAQFLAGITGSMGSLMGGTTTGEMTKPPPDPYATAAGLGLGAAGLFLSDARAKTDIEPIGKTNDGLPIYRFKYAGSPDTQIGLLAQDVEQVHPEAVAEIGGLKHIDPLAATEDAARAPQGFAQGGVPGMPWGNVQGFIPTMELTRGKTEPDLDKWPEEKATDYTQMGKLAGGIGKAAWDKWGSSAPASPGGAGFVHDWNRIQFGGAARGGGVWAPGGYAEGGGPVDSFNARFNPLVVPEEGSLVPAPVRTVAMPPALDNAVKGFADRYPEFSAFSGPEAMRGPLEELAAERERVHRAEALSKPVPTYATPVETPEPSFAKNWMDVRKAIPVSGVAPPVEDPTMTVAGAPPRTPVMAPPPEPYRDEPPDYRAPTTFSASPEAPPPRRGFGLLGKIDDATGAALLAAGFGMMASRSPHLGVAVGEGGLSGLSAYAGQRAAERETEEKRLTRAEQSRRIDLEAARLQQQADQFAKTHGLAQSKEKLAQRKEALDELKPIVIHRQRDRYGNVLNEILGVRDPKTGGYRVINPDGSMGAVVQPGQIPAPTPAGTPNTTVAPRVASEEEQGIIPRNATLVASGPYDYRSPAPSLEKGMDVPEPAPAAGRGADAIKREAELYLQTGKLPKVSIGKSPVAVEQKEYRDTVQNYASALAQSRGITPEQSVDMWRTAPGMLRFILGADGRATVSLGTAVRHLDTLRELAKAWDAGDIQMVNKVRAAIERQFGKNAITDLEAAGRIIGPEIIKAIGVAGAGTHDERMAAQAAFSGAVSPAQMLGAIATTQKLLGGQLEGRKRQAMNAGLTEERFKSLIGERPYEILSTAEGGHGAPPPASTRTLSDQDRRALDWAKNNPRDPRARAIKQRLGAE